MKQRSGCSGKRLAVLAERSHRQRFTSCSHKAPPHPAERAQVVASAVDSERVHMLVCASGTVASALHQGAGRFMNLIACASQCEGMASEAAEVPWNTMNYNLVHV
jgi:hypothetical protein